MTEGSVDWMMQLSISPITKRPDVQSNCQIWREERSTGIEMCCCDCSDRKARRSSRVDRPYAPRRTQNSPRYRRIHALLVCTWNIVWDNSCYITKFIINLKRQKIPNAFFHSSQIYSSSLPTREVWETFLPQWNLIRNNNNTVKYTSMCILKHWIGVQDRTKREFEKLVETSWEHSIGDAAKAVLRITVVSAYREVQEGTRLNTTP